MDVELKLVEIPHNHLVVRPISQAYYIFWLSGLSAVEWQRYELAALDISRGEGFLFASMEIHDKDERHLISLLGPSQISFIITLCDGDYAFGAYQGIDEALRFLILIGDAEIVEDDGVGCWIYEFILFWVEGGKKQRVFDLAIIMRNVFLYDWIFESGVLLYFKSTTHPVSYNY